MFITFEGIDGSGKSTQIEKLKQALSRQDLPVHVFREPGGTALSEQVRSLLLDSDLDIDPVAELLLFSSARAQLVGEKIRPLLEQDQIIILDRYYDSTVAYQGYGRGSLPLADIHRLNAIASQGITPDLTFYLKLPLEVARRRTHKNPKDRMEKAGRAFFERVVEGFDTMAAGEERIIAVDATGPAGETHRAIMDHIDRFLDE